MKGDLEEGAIDAFHKKHPVIQEWPFGGVSREGYGAGMLNREAAERRRQAMEQDAEQAREEEEMRAMREKEAEMIGAVRERVLKALGEQANDSAIQAMVDEVSESTAVRRILNSKITAEETMVLSVNVFEKGNGEAPDLDAVWKTVRLQEAVKYILDYISIRLRESSGS